MLAEIVDLGAIWQTVWTAAVAGVAVIVVYSLAVVGSSRVREARGGAAAAYGLLALLGGAGTLAAIAYGIVLITSK